MRKELRELSPPPAGGGPRGRPAAPPPARAERQASGLRLPFSRPPAYRQAVGIEPENGEYRYNLGTFLHQRRRDLAEAIDALSRAAAPLPSDYRVLRNLANLQCDARRFREAVDTIDQIAANFGQDDPWLLQTRGSVQLELGSLAAPEESYLLAARADPDDAGPHVKLARLYRRQKREKEATDHLHAVQRLRRELARYFEMVLQHEP